MLFDSCCDPALRWRAGGAALRVVYITEMTVDPFEALVRITS